MTCPRCDDEGCILVPDRPRPDDISPPAHYEPCPECQPLPDMVEFRNRLDATVAMMEARWERNREARR